MDFGSSEAFVLQKTCFLFVDPSQRCGFESPVVMQFRISLHITLGLESQR